LTYEIQSANLRYMLEIRSCITCFCFFLTTLNPLFVFIDPADQLLYMH